MIVAGESVPGSKQRKRYEDVLEILDAGISVITAVNVQHIESLAMGHTVARLSDQPLPQRGPRRHGASCPIGRRRTLKADRLCLHARSGVFFTPKTAGATLAIDATHQRRVLNRRFKTREIEFGFSEKLEPASGGRVITVTALVWLSGYDSGLLESPGRAYKLEFGGTSMNMGWKNRQPLPEE